MLRKVLLFLLLWIPVQGREITLLPLEGLSPHQNEVLAVALGEILSNQGYILQRGSVFPAEGLSLEGRFLELSSQKYFSFFLKEDREIKSGAQRGLKQWEEVFPLLPSIVEELLPPRQGASSNAKIQRSLLILPAEASLDPILRLLGKELQNAFSSVLYDNPSLESLKGDGNLTAFIEAGKELGADALLKIDIQSLSHSKIYTFSLISVLDGSTQNEGTWYAGSPFALEAFVSQMAGTLLGGSPLPVLAPLLAPLNANLGGRALARLVNKGIETRNTAGESPLAIAVRHGWADIAEALLHQGASPKAADHRAWTALHWAASLGGEDILQRLIEAGAPLNSQNAEGWTPLICAVLQGRVGEARLLIQAGANLSLQDKKGLDAFRWAEIRKSRPMIRLLQQAQNL